MQYVSVAIDTSDRDPQMAECGDASPVNQLDSPDIRGKAGIQFGGRRHGGLARIYDRDVVPDRRLPRSQRQDGREHPADERLGHMHDLHRSPPLHLLVVAANSATRNEYRRTNAA